MELSTNFLVIGNVEEAQTAAKGAVAIMLRLTELKPDNMLWQRDLSVSYNRIADVLLAAGDRTGALENYRKGLAIFDKLARSDPGNVQGQTDLIVSHFKLAQAGDTPRENLVRALEIVKRLESEGKLSAQQQGWVDALEQAIDALDASHEASPAGQPASPTSATE